MCGKCEKVIFNQKFDGNSKSDFQVVQDNHGFYEIFFKGNRLMKVPCKELTWKAIQELGSKYGKV